MTTFPRRSARRLFAHLFLLSVLTGLALLSSARAQGTYTVTSADDDGSAGTLRWAINQANAAAGSTIVFNDNLGTVTLTSALPPITAATTINGGTGNTVSGANLHRVFLVNAPSAAVSIQNLTIANGYAQGGTGGPGAGGGLGAGGGIYVHAGDVSLAGVTMQNNSAHGGNAGDSLYNSYFGGTGGASSGPGGPDNYGRGGDAGTPPGSPTGGGFGAGGGGGTSSLAAGGDFGGRGGIGRADVPHVIGPGGGGAALGGALFVAGWNGASLTISDYTLEAGTVTAGAAGDQIYSGLGTSPAAGQAAGSTLFLHGGSTSFGDGILPGTVGLFDGASFVKAGSGTLLVTGGISAFTRAGAAGSTIALNAGTLAFDSTADSILGAITGSGALSKQNSGTLTFISSNPAYTGTVTLHAGALSLAADGALGTGTLSLLGGELRGDGTPRFLNNPLIFAGNFVVGRNLTLTGTAVVSSPTTITADNPSGAANANTVFSGVIDGEAGLTIAQGANGIGTGAIVFSGNNTYTGLTTIASGRLQIGNGGASGSITGEIVNNAALTFDRSDDFTHGAGISGTGTLTKLGANTLTVAAAFAHTGGTTISAGTLRIADGGSLAGPTVNNAALIFDREAGLVLAGAISGTGSVTKRGGGTLTFDGAATHSGGTTIEIGVLRAGAANLFSPNSTVTLANDADAILDLASFNQTLGGIAGGGASGGTVLIGSAALTVGANHANTAFAGRFDGTGTLIKTGNGTLTLTGVNDHTGGTTVSAGTLIFNDNAALGSGSLTLAGSTLRFAPGNTSDISSRTVTLTSGRVILDTNGNDVVFANAIGNGGAGMLDKAGLGTLTLLGHASHTGGTQINEGVLQIGNGGATGSIAGPIQNYRSLVINRSGSLALGAISGSGSVTLNGPGTVTLNNPASYTGFTTINAGVLKAGVAGVLPNSARLHFADTAGAAFDLNGLNQTVATLSGGGAAGGNILLGAATLTLYDYGLFNYTYKKFYAGSISGTGGVTIAATNFVGSNVQVFSGANTYSGLTTLGSGITRLLVDATNTLSPNSTVLFSASSALSLSGVSNADPFDQEVAGISSTGGAGSIGLGGATLTVGRTNASSSFSGVLAGPGGLVKVGTGALTLTGASGVSGPIAVRLEAGALVVGHNTALGTGVVTLAGGELRTNGSARTLSNSLVLAGDFNLGRQLTFTGAATLENSITITAYNADGAANNDYAFNGAIGGAHGITIVEGANGIGTGAIAFGGANTYTGGTRLSSGRLAIESDAALGASTGNLTFNGGTLKLTAAISGTRGVVVNATNGTIESNGFAATFGGISGPGYLGVSGGGNVTLVGTSVFEGNLGLAGGSLRIAPGATLQLGNDTATGTVSAPIVVDGTLAFRRSDDVYYEGVLSGAGSVSQLGAGMLTLGGANGYASDTIVAGGILRLAHASALGTSGRLTLAGGTLDLNGHSQAFTQLSGSGGRFSNSGGSVATLSLNLAADATLQSAITDGASPIALVKAGAGGLTLNAANGYSGGTILSGGIVALGHNGALGSGAVTLDGAALRASGGSRTLANAFSVTNDTTLGGSFALTLSGPVTLARSRELTVTGTARTLISGAIGESGGGRVLAKYGAGELELTGANTYTGGTFIGEGTVRINNGSGSAFGSGAVTVASGGTLTGAGTFSGAFQNNGTYAPGNSPTLATLSSFNQGSTGLLLMEIGGLTRGTQYDALNITGTVTFGGTLQVSLINGFNPTAGNSFDLLNYTIASGTFSQLNLPTLTSGLSWNTSALYTTGVLGVISAIPEPSTYALLAGAGALGLVVWRRRRTA